MEKTVLNPIQSRFFRSMSYSKNLNIAKNRENSLKSETLNMVPFPELQDTFILKNIRHFDIKNPKIKHLKTENDYEIIKQIRKTRKTLFLETCETQDQLNPVKVANLINKNKLGKKVCKTDFLFQKRELFLIQMKMNDRIEKMHSLNCIKTETAEKLSRFELQIESDVSKIKLLMEDNIKIRNEQDKCLDDLANEKGKTDLKLKELSDRKNSKLVCNKHLFQNLILFFSYKEFLDPILESSEIYSRSGKRMTSLFKFRNRANSGLNFDFLKVKDIALQKSKVASDIKQVFLMKSIFGKKSKRETKTNFSKSILAAEKFDKKSNNSFVSKQFETNLQQKTETGISPVEDYTSAEIISRMYGTVDFSVINLFRETITTTVIQKLKEPFKLVDIYQTIEEENLNLIKKTQKFKNKLEQKSKKLAFLREKEFQKNQKREISKEKLISKIKKISSIIEFKKTHFEEKPNLSDKINQISNQLNILKRVLCISDNQDLGEDLKNIENRLSLNIEKVKTIDSALFFKLNQRIREETKLARFELQEKLNTNLDEQKLKQIKQRKVNLCKVRQINNRSFSRVSFKKEEDLK